MKREARRKDGPAFIGDASLLPDLNGDSFDENKVFEIYVKSADALLNYKLKKDCLAGG